MRTHVAVWAVLVCPGLLLNLGCGKPKEKSKKKPPPPPRASAPKTPVRPSAATAGLTFVQQDVARCPDIVSNAQIAKVEPAFLEMIQAIESGDRSKLLEYVDPRITEPERLGRQHVLQILQHSDLTPLLNAFKKAKGRGIAIRAARLGTPADIPQPGRSAERLNHVLVTIPARQREPLAQHEFCLVDGKWRSVHLTCRVLSESKNRLLSAYRHDAVVVAQAAAGAIVNQELPVIEWLLAARLPVTDKHQAKVRAPGWLLQVRKRSHYPERHRMDLTRPEAGNLSGSLRWRFPVEFKSAGNLLLHCALEVTCKTGVAGKPPLRYEWTIALESR